MIVELGWCDLWWISITTLDEWGGSTVSSVALAQLRTWHIAMHAIATSPMIRWYLRASHLRGAECGVLLHIILNCIYSHRIHNYRGLSDYGGSRYR